MQETASNSPDRSRPSEGREEGGGGGNGHPASEEAEAEGGRGRGAVGREEPEGRHFRRQL